MKKITTIICFFCLTVGLFGALPDDALLPGYREVPVDVSAQTNPFEPIREARPDTDSALVEAFVKRLKGYVIQSTGVPLLVIDDKSYKVGDRVELSGGAAGSDAAQQSEDGVDQEGTAENIATSNEYAVIVSVSPTEAVFRKEDTTGFGGQVFKIYYNFSHITDDEGRSMYDVWEPVATGFFVSEDGLVVAPLDVVRSGEFSVQTQNGARKALLVAQDPYAGLALLKIGYKAIPLQITKKAPDIAQPVYPVGYLPQKSSQLSYMEGFVADITDDGYQLRPAVSGEFVGSPVIDKAGLVTGILVGSSQDLEDVAVLSADSKIFSKYELPERAVRASSRAAIEQSVVQILKKR